MWYHRRTFMSRFFSISSIYFRTNLIIFYHNRTTCQKRISTSKFLVTCLPHIKSHIAIHLQHQTSYNKRAFRTTLLFISFICFETNIVPLDLHQASNDQGILITILLFTPVVHIHSYTSAINLIIKHPVINDHLGKQSCSIDFSTWH